MEPNLAVFKGADMTEDILQEAAGVLGILAYPVGGVGMVTISPPSSRNRRK